MFRLYARVLGLLGPQMRLGWLLALANVALATAALAEPVLFGRIIDALAGAQGAGGALDWPRLTPLVAAWVGFGLFLIVCGALVSLYADKLAHRRRQAVLSDYFEHVLQLPLSFHSATHSGRLMKVMLTGTDTLWWLWLGFFREHLAAIVSIAVLLPLALYLNWRLGLLLIGLALIFLALTTFVLRKTEAMQKSVERYYSDLAERASDTLGNVALVQSFTRVEDEVRELARGGRAPARRANAGAFLVGAGLNPHQGLDHAHHAGDPGPRPLTSSRAGRRRSAASSCS